MSTQKMKNVNTWIGLNFIIMVARFFCINWLTNSWFYNSRFTSSLVKGRAVTCRNLNLLSSDGWLTPSISLLYYKKEGYSVLKKTDLFDFCFVWFFFTNLIIFVMKQFLRNRKMRKNLIKWQNIFVGAL